MTEPITIQVDPQTAGAYRRMNDEERERVRAAVEQAVMQREEAVAEFRRISARMSAEAAAAGLTQEKLDELLSEDE